MDLDNLFKTTSSSKDKKNNTIDLVVSDDMAFLQAIDELYAIEGFASPLKVDDIDDESWHKTSAEIKHVVLDLRDCGEPCFGSGGNIFKIRCEHLSDCVKQHGLNLDA